ncbi:MAG: hypothetical protein L0G70_08665, partial [Rubrobacter sp.]|nr:hypothetical protein [Rubrobacter sp.]
MAAVSFDYTNMMEIEGGVGERELKEARTKLERAAESLAGESMGFMRLPREEDLALVIELANEIRSSGATDFVHAGIGGSALGPMALHRALNHPFYNQLTEERPGPRLHFAENTD